MPRSLVIFFNISSLPDKLLSVTFKARDSKTVELLSFEATKVSFHTIYSSGQLGRCVNDP